MSNVTLLLKEFLPRAGMVYPPGKGFLRRRWQAKKILSGLIGEKVIKLGKRDAFNGTNKRAVDQELATMFDHAPVALLHATESGLDFEGFLNCLQSSVPWAKRCSIETFNQFCCRLVMARHEWRKHPTYPYEFSLHSKTAQSIDRMMDTIKGDYDLEWFQIWEWGDLVAHEVDLDDAEDEVYLPGDYDGMVEGANMVTDEQAAAATGT